MVAEWHQQPTVDGEQHMLGCVWLVRVWRLLKFGVKVLCEKQAWSKAYSQHDLEQGFLTKVNLILAKWINLPCCDMEGI